MKNMTINPREKALVIIAVVSVGIAAFTRVAVYPLIRRYQSVSREIEGTLGQMKRHGAFLSRASANDDAATMPAVQADNTLGALAYLERTARENGLTLTNVKQLPGDARAGAGAYEEVSIEMSCQGDVQGYERFTQKVESGSVQFQIKSLRLLPRRSGQNVIEGHFVIVFRSFLP